MTFGIWEWVRVVAYAVSVPAACYLFFRFMHRGDMPLAMLMAGIACLFGWYLVDLTMVSVGLSSRETRNFATPITVFAAGSLATVTLRELRQHALEKRIRRLGATLDGNGNGNTNGMSHANSH